MHTEQQQLEAAITALETQRAVLGDAVVEALLGPARARLAELAAMPAPEPDAAQALRQVSILFLDVVGSTTLSQILDPEAISAVMDDALARGTAIVRTHRGRVLQYAGDNILAAFGADEAREDDAERAVRCGLALLKLGRTLGAEVQRVHGHAGFDFRVGIHTGGVLLGGGVADGSIRGMAVNIAARMEQTAPAGALRISQDTHALVRGLFEVQAQPPLQVKGVDEPVQSWLVDKPAARSFRAGSRGIEGVATRMVGRDAELAALRAAFDKVQRSGRLEAVTVVAEAGIGKSRLLHEFERALEGSGSRCLRLRSRCTPATPMQPYGLLRELLAGAWGLRDDDTLPRAQAEVAAAVVPLFEADEGSDAALAHAHLLGHLLGIDHGSSPHVAALRGNFGQIRERAWKTAVQWFRRKASAERCPILLLLEDLHWADDLSLDFMAHLADLNADVPLLLLALARPTLDERRQPWLGEAVRHQRIGFGPLDPAASQALVAELLQRLPQVPESLRQQLTDGAEGNPFYLEELVKMLIDQRAITIDADSGAWSVDADRLRLTKVPATLTGVLQARLDSLRAGERLTLQQASVIGPVFWDRVLLTLDARAELELPVLVHKALAVPRSQDEAPDGLREYAFNHQLLHQVTYDTVLKRPKRELHAKVAQWLAALTGARAGDFLALTADHFERAGDHANAIEYHARAAKRAENLLANDTVLASSQKGLALLGPPPGAELGLPARRADAELRWRLHFSRALTFGNLGRREEWMAQLVALDEAAELLDDERRAYAALMRSEQAAHWGDWAANELHARRGLALANQAGHRLHRLRATFLLASARKGQADLEGCRTLALQGLADARSGGPAALIGAFLNILAQTASLQGAVLESVELNRETMLLLRDSGHVRNVSVVECSLASALLDLGELDQAGSHFEQALQRARALGSRPVECSALTGQSTLARWRGDVDRARALAQAAMDIATQTRSEGAEWQAALALGEADLDGGRHAEARQAFDEALVHARPLGLATTFEVAAGRARLHLAEGEAEAAGQLLADLLAHGGAGGTLDGTRAPRLVEWTCHRVLSRLGHQAQADAWLRRAHGALMAQAGAIPDPAQRAGFLGHIPHHAAIAAAWDAHAPRPS